VATARSIVQRGLNGNNAEVLDFLVQLLLALGCDAALLAPTAPSVPLDLRTMPVAELEQYLARVAFRSKPAPASRQFAAVNTKLLRPAGIGHVRALLVLATDAVAAERGTTGKGFGDATSKLRETLSASFMEVSSHKTRKVDITSPRPAHRITFAQALEVVLAKERSAGGWYRYGLYQQPFELIFHHNISNPFAVCWSWSPCEVPSSAWLSMRCSVVPPAKTGAMVRRVACSRPRTVGGWLASCSPY
jgi:hypothetical protein